jgi:hypothetical protein
MVLVKVMSKVKLPIKGALISLRSRSFVGIQGIFVLELCGRSRKCNQDPSRSFAIVREAFVVERPRHEDLSTKDIIFVQEK